MILNKSNLVKILTAVLLSLTFACGKDINLSTKASENSSEESIALTVGNASESFTFVSIPDFLNHDAASPESGWEESIQVVLNAIKAEKPDFVLVAGDLVKGRWWTSADIDTYADHAYASWKDRMQKNGLKYYTAVGDHEIGDLPVPQSWLDSLGITTHPSSLFDIYKDKYKVNMQMPQNGPDKFKGTAFSLNHKSSLFVVVDVFDKNAQGEISTTVNGEQLSWLRSVLEKNRSATHVFIVGHTPIIGPVRMMGSSGIMLEKGEQSALWQLMKEFKVDAYLCGEVHEITAINKDNILQISHGGLAGVNPYLNYLVGKVTSKKIDFTLKQIRTRPHGNRDWNPGTSLYLPWEKIRIDPGTGFESVGSVEVNKMTSSKQFLNRSGYFSDYSIYNEVSGTSGDDRLTLGNKRNWVAASSGTDIITAGSGDDVITMGGAFGAKTITGGAGNDYIRGGAESDILMGNEGNDDIYGDTGDDLIYGGKGDDILMGMAGNDTLYGNIGDDYLNGDEGNDTYIYSGGDGIDTIEDLLGSNTLVLRNINMSKVSVTRSKGNLIISPAEGGQITIEHFDAGNWTITPNLSVPSTVYDAQIIQCKSKSGSSATINGSTSEVFTTISPNNYSRWVVSTDLSIQLNCFPGPISSLGRLVPDFGPTSTAGFLCKKYGQSAGFGRYLATCSSIGTVAPKTSPQPSPTPNRSSSNMAPAPVLKPPVATPKPPVATPKPPVATPKPPVATPKPPATVTEKPKIPTSVSCVSDSGNSKTLSIKSGSYFIGLSPSKASRWVVSLDGKYRLNCYPGNPPSSGYAKPNFSPGSAAGNLCKTYGGSISGVGASVGYGRFLGNCSLIY